MTVSAAIGALAIACSSSTSTAEDTVAPPPRICKPPKTAPQGAWFTDVTSDVGLGRGGPSFPLATGVIAADLDGDGFSDFIALYGASKRGLLPADHPYAGKRARAVYINRPDPADPAHRIFVETTVESGVLATRDGAGERGFSLANAGDLDNDGDVDLVLCNAEALTREYTPLDACEAFLNDGKGHFVLAEPSALGAKVFWAPSGALFDYDRDGVLDFWPATIAHWPYDPMGPNNQRPLLFRGNGDGTFENVAAEVGLPTKDGTPEDGTSFRHTFGVTACDLDGDGDDDIVLASYGRQENWVFRNDGGKFTNVAKELGLAHDDRVDYNDDQSYRCYCQENPTKCPEGTPGPPFQFCGAFGGKLGRGWYPGITDQPYALGGNHFTFACGDIDDDGDMDLVSATIVHGDVGSSADPTEIIVNPGNGARFERPGNDKTGMVRPAKGIYWNHGDDMAVMVDVDLDGKKDIFTTTTGAYEMEDHARLWHQKADRTFEELAVSSGLVPADFKKNLHGPAWIDIDGDGDLDLVVGDTRNGRLTVLRNDVGQDRNLVRIRLVGKGAGGANVSAIGAKVRVKAGGVVQTDYVRGGYGQSNVENDLVLTFGLGDACDIESIEVTWPNAEKTVTTYEHVLANYAITIREGKADVEYPATAPRQP